MKQVKSSGFKKASQTITFKKIYTKTYEVKFRRNPMAVYEKHVCK